MRPLVEAAARHALGDPQHIRGDEPALGAVPHRPHDRVTGAGRVRLARATDRTPRHRLRRRLHGVDEGLRGFDEGLRGVEVALVSPVTQKSPPVVTEKSSPR